MNSTLPPLLWRVQHDGSFTYYHHISGFTSRKWYLTQYACWLNREKIIKHLDWYDRSEESTPFISTFDNEEDAMRRAQFHVARGDRNVFVATILTSGLRPQTIPLDVWNNGVTLLPVFKCNDPDFAIFSMEDAAQLFNIGFQFVQDSEWLVINKIPGSRIVQKRYL